MYSYGYKSTSICSQFKYIFSDATYDYFTKYKFLYIEFSIGIEYHIFLPASTLLDIHFPLLIKGSPVTLPNNVASSVSFFEVNWSKRWEESAHCPFLHSSALFPRSLQVNFTLRSYWMSDYNALKNSFKNFASDSWREKGIRRDTVIYVQSAAIPFTPRSGRFCDENFLRYLNLCYINPIYNKLRTFPLL